MELIRRAAAEGKKPDLQALVDAIPYCKFLGIEVDRKGTELTTILRFSQRLIGNPVLQRFTVAWSARSWKSRPSFN
jgi:hypothetical protein